MHRSMLRLFLHARVEGVSEPRWLADEERLPLSPVERLGVLRPKHGLGQMPSVAEAQMLGEKMSWGRVGDG